MSTGIIRYGALYVPEPAATAIALAGRTSVKVSGAGRPAASTSLSAVGYLAIWLRGVAGLGGSQLVANPLYVASAVPRRLVATALPRLLTVTGFRTTMAATRDLSPAIDAVSEYLTITFDFGPMLASAVSISSIVSVTSAVYAGAANAGIDAAPGSRLIGSPALAPSPATGLANQAVLQQVGSMVGGVTYTLQCVILTSDGSKPSLWTHLPCVTPS